MYKNLAAAVAAASLVSTALSQGHPAPSSPAGSTPLKAAFVYLTPVLDAGWTRQHDEGRRALQAALGPRVQTRAVDSVPEGPDAERVLRDLAASGNQLIFTTSFGYTESVMRVARDFPQVKFESVTGFKRADNVATSNARYYEGRYLSGIAAGRASKTGVAGFVVGFPIPERVARHTPSGLPVCAGNFGPSCRPPCARKCCSAKRTWPRAACSPSRPATSRCATTRARCAFQPASSWTMHRSCR